MGQRRGDAFGMQGKTKYLVPIAAVALAFAVFALVKANQGKDGQTPPASGSAKPPVVQAEQIEQKRAELLAEAEALAASYFYDEATELLESDPDLVDESITAKAEEIKAQKAALVKYDGKVFHIFFHSLIIDTAKAFDGDRMENGYNMWMTTQSEFQKMLPLLLENNFVLYDLEELVEKTEDGKVKPKDIYLPEGKKPLVISVDDVSYYDYMKEDGFANRLDLNADGEVVTVMKNEDGTETETFDGDVMPILDKFVEEHPEFSFRGAKGTIAVTGYQGAFGYRITDLTGDDLKAAQKKCMEVSDRLLKTGWKLASHSYTHNSYFSTGKITMEEMKSDTDRWKTLIEPYITGLDSKGTGIFISPQGANFKPDDARYRYLIDSGFYIYCPVGAGMNMRFNEDNMVQERLNVDGYTMLTHPERVSKYFFDPALVLDPTRPPLKLD